MKRIGILGGTFNPPHCGHLSIAEDLLAEFQLDEILLLPVGIPPHKRDMNIASNEHRLEMLQLMTAHDPRLVVSDMEMQRGGYTYTVDTLTALREMQNDCLYYYIIGTDTLFTLTTWRRYEEVFGLTHFLCVPRPGDRHEDILAKIDELHRTFGAVIHLAKSTGPDISSTMIREKRKNNESLAGLVPAAVEEYMKHYGIFG
ncbi:MAG: nicotinate-nucleotide adenylyltransferase [Christensenellaceae bacterium]|nr:nicotinate-nucleotide adenylyltransferase [Christensenellaceae bacterium]